MKQCLYSKTRECS